MVNKALDIVKVIFQEAPYREENNRDPTAGVGKIKERRKDRGIFTVEELRALWWLHINFEQRVLIVSEAWKGGKEIGPPKWDHNRLVPLSPRTINTIVQDYGHDRAKIRAVLGWMDEAVQDTYTHLDLDHLKALADIVNEIWQV